MKRSSELGHLRQLCSLGLPAPAVVPAVLRAVRHLVASDSAGFFWVDAQGDIVNMYAERMLPPALIRAYFERHYTDDAYSFRAQLAARVARGEPVDEVRVDAVFEASPYYREILQPLDVHRILYALVSDAGQVIGQLSLYRSRQAPPFSSADRELLLQATRYLGPGLAWQRRGDAAVSRNGTPWRDSALEALLVCDVEGAIQSASYRAHALLAHASGVPLNRATLSGELERAGAALVRRLLSRLNGKSSSEDPVQLEVDNDWGRYRLRGYVLGDRRYGVLVTRQEHLLVRIADAMRLRPLSAQQREVALLLARGLTNPEIAQALDVSLNTASYHVKQLFQKLDAHDRAEAIARILDGHTERRG